MDFTQKEVHVRHSFRHVISVKIVLRYLWSKVDVTESCWQLRNSTCIILFGFQRKENQDCCNIAPNMLTFPKQFNFFLEKTFHRSVQDNT